MVLTLRKKIFFGYGIILTLMIVIFVWSLANLVGLSYGILRIRNTNTLVTENMSSAVERQNNGILLIIRVFQLWVKITEVEHAVS